MLVRKRDGSLVPFDKTKIEEAIRKAHRAVYSDYVPAILDGYLPVVMEAVLMPQKARVVSTTNVSRVCR